MHSLHDQLTRIVKDMSHAQVSLIPCILSTSTGLSGSTVALYLTLNPLVKTIFLYGSTALRTLAAFPDSFTFYTVDRSPWRGGGSGRRKAATYTQNTNTE
jgi:hypothetical protein